MQATCYCAPHQDLHDGRRSDSAFYSLVEDGEDSETTVSAASKVRALPLNNGGEWTLLVMPVYYNQLNRLDTARPDGLPRHQRSPR